MKLGPDEFFVWWLQKLCLQQRQFGNQKQLRQEIRL